MYIIKIPYESESSFRQVEANTSGRQRCRETERLHEQRAQVSRMGQKDGGLYHRDCAGRGPGASS